jgi:hypothetical protein
MVVSGHIGGDPQEPSPSIGCRTVVPFPDSKRREEDLSEKVFGCLSVRLTSQKTKHSWGVPGVQDREILGLGQ